MSAPTVVAADNAQAHTTPTTTPTNPEPEILSSIFVAAQTQPLEAVSASLSELHTSQRHVLARLNTQQTTYATCARQQLQQIAQTFARLPVYEKRVRGMMKRQAQLEKRVAKLRRTSDGLATRAGCSLPAADAVVPPTSTEVLAAAVSKANLNASAAADNGAVPPVVVSDDTLEAAKKEAPPLKRKQKQQRKKQSKR
jgi:hypothetical protein